MIINNKIFNDDGNMNKFQNYFKNFINFNIYYSIIIRNLIFDLNKIIYLNHILNNFIININNNL